MADIKLFFPKVLAFEGGFVNDPTDKGGATNKGVTLATWKQIGYDKDGDGDIDVEDIKLLSSEDAEKVCKKNYWDRWKADNIINQSIAEQLVDWVWASGKWGITIPQQILGVKADGLVGNKTLQGVNFSNAKELHRMIIIARLNFIDGIVSHSVSEYKKTHPLATNEELLKFTQKRFEKGWKRRINELSYTH